MGNCSTLEPKQSFSNPDDPIGTKYEIVDGCGPMGTVKNHLQKYIPQNGEYDWAGEGNTCYYCSIRPGKKMTCSSGCDSKACCSIIGKGGTYKRTRYLADPVQCCLKSVPTISDKTCDPKYRNPKSEACFSAIKNYCIEGDRLFTDNVCQSWCANNQQECFLYKQRLCDKSIANKFCKDWCMQNHGYCDNSFKAYCDTTTINSDPSCACIKSDLIKYKYNPLCEDRTCIGSGYQTSSMISSLGSGCQIVDCGVYFDVAAQGSVIFDDVNIEQKCTIEQQQKAEAAEAAEAADKKSKIAVIGSVSGAVIILSLLPFI